MAHLGVIRIEWECMSPFGNTIFLMLAQQECSFSAKNELKKVVEIRYTI
jgi:hypothetical protein